MSNNTYWAVVPAAGSGSRLGGQRPKQYLHLQGKPILQHTLERLCAVNIAGIVVCVAESDPYWETLKLPACQVIRAAGGIERCHSVLNGLKVLQQYAQPDDWILVHDAARPCVRLIDIERLMKKLADHPIGGLLALPVRDTMKRADSEGKITETVSRSGLWHALTPQMFRFKLLLSALQTVLEKGEMVTDDAQAMEQAGYQPVLVEGHSDNIKITHPQDLDLAALYLEKQAYHAH